MLEVSVLRAPEIHKKVQMANQQTEELFNIKSKCKLKQQGDTFDLLYSID